MAAGGVGGSDYASLAECPVCFERYRDPRQFQCGHTLCLECVDNIWTSNREVRCPLCRRVVLISQEGPIGLPVNRFVINFLDLLENTCNEDPELPRKCNPCAIKKLDSDSHSYCKDCKKHLCVICATKHKTIPVFAKHEVVSKNIVDVLCQNHGDGFNYICLQCNRLLCSDCIEAEVCQGHDLQEVNQVVEDRSSQLHDIILKLTTEISRFDSSQPNISKVEENLRKLKVMMEMVHSQMDTLKKKIDKNGNDKIKELEKEHDRLMKIKTQNIELDENSKRQMALLYSLRDAATSALNKGKEHIVTALPNIKAQIPDTSQVHIKYADYTIKVPHFSPLINSVKVGKLVWRSERIPASQPKEGNFTQFRNIDPSTAGLQKQVNSADQNRTPQFASNRPKTMPEQVLKPSILASPRHMRPRLQGQQAVDILHPSVEGGSEHNSCVLEIQNPTNGVALTFLPTGNIVVSEETSNRVLLYDKNGVEIANSATALPRLDMEIPGSIVYHRQEQAVMVSLNAVMNMANQIMVLNPQSLFYIRHFPVNVAGGVLQLDVMRNGTLVVLAKNHEIHIYDTQGVCLQHSVLSKISSIAVNSVGELIVKEESKTDVFFYNIIGTQIAKKGKIRLDSSQLCECLAVDNFGVYSNPCHVIVAERSRTSSETTISLYEKFKLGKIVLLRQESATRIKAIAKQGSIVAVLTDRIQLYST